MTSDDVRATLAEEAAVVLWYQASEALTVATAERPFGECADTRKSRSASP